MDLDNYLVYKIKANDSLKSVANRLGLEPDFLEKFHNEKCNSQEKIYHHILLENETLYVPICSRYKHINKNERPSENFSTQTYFPTYLVLETIEQVGTDKIDVTYFLHLKFSEDNKNNHVTIHRNNLKRNREKPDDKISTLALACYNSISPIGLKIKENGTFYAFEDYKTILENFKQNKKSIEEYFIGNIAKEYLNLFELNLKNETYFFKQFTNQLLFKLIFPNLSWFNKNKEWEETIDFIFKENEMKCKLHANYLHENEGPIYTTIKGNTLLDDEESYKRGEFCFNYVTDRLNKKILEANAEVILFTNDEVLKKHTVKINQPH